MKRFLISASILMTCGLTIRAEYIDWVDWSKIQHWAGDPEGEKKCALVVDFQDGLSNQAYVWGFRWNGTATGEDLVRAVASQSSVLTAMIQYTGTMGSTLNALGLSSGRKELDYIHYDFSAASVASEISFGFFDPNITMGQESAPGYEAESLCYAALEAAKESGIIEHPLNAFIYGYAAYDYDYWQLSEDFQNNNEHRWKSGWYDGYWSYWHGPNDYDYLGYSGLGMSSTVLVDGGVQAWKYTPLNGGGGFGDTGGEMAFELNYDMEDWEEEMHAPSVRQPLVDHNAIQYWVGQGEKAAAVVLQFNDGKGPDNLVYGYKWSGGWDDDLLTVVSNIAKTDSRIRFYISDKDLHIEYDSDDDGNISEIDHNDAEGEWTLYVKRTVDQNFNSVPGGRWLNPNAVLILSRKTEEDNAFTLPYQLMRPTDDSAQIVSIPEKIEYTLSDKPLQIPMFLQVPEDSKVNGAFTWTRPEMLSRINTHQFMGTVSSYSNFTPCEAEVTVRGSYVPAGTTSAEGFASNIAKISFKAPEIPLTSIRFEEDVIRAEERDSFQLPLIKLPEDATYTGLTFRSSNPEIVSVNAATGEVTTFNREGSAVVTATYNIDEAVTARCTINVVIPNSLSEFGTDHQKISVEGNLLTMKGMAGHDICFVNLWGQVALRIIPVSDFEQASLSLPAGVYIVTDNNHTVMKITIK